MQNKLKSKHNKKRNTAFLFEALIKELTKAVISKNKTQQKNVSILIREHFKKGGLLDKELTLYKQLYATDAFPKNVAEKLITQVKNDYDKLNETEIFNEQSRLIGKINKFIGAQVYNNFVPNYKTLATISQIFNKSVEPRQKVLLEQELMETITSEKQEKKVIVEKTETSVLNSFIRKFNEAYGDKLLTEQKTLLSKFINYSNEDVELKVYLNEEISRLKQCITESLDSELVKSNKEALQKVNTLKQLLESFTVESIDEELIKKVMFIQEFAAEVQK